MSSSEPTRRTRGDLCPGVLRPWPAADGALVRLRVPGGRVSPASLAALHGVAARYGDDDVHVTTRANLQLRGLPTGPDGRLPDEVVAAIAETGLLPAPGHELVRNILVSPLTGLLGGRTDLRPLTDRLDAGLLADPALAGLPGRFLFVLDDGRGDLLERTCDLGLAALDGRTAQLRVGPEWADVVLLAEAAGRLVELAREFVHVRGTGPDAPWHVRELTAPLPASFAGPLPDPLVGPLPASITGPGSADPRLPVASAALPYGPVDPTTHEPATHEPATHEPATHDPASGSPHGLSAVPAGDPPGRIEHVEATDGILGRALIARLTAPEIRELIVTPWRGVLAVSA